MMPSNAKYGVPFCCLYYAGPSSLRSGEAPLGFRQAPPPPVPMPMSHFLVRPRRAAATRTNAAIDASRRGANVNF